MMQFESLVPGALYLVATPIGHLGELSPRAVSVLKHVDYVLCEDTRHSRRLFNEYGLKVRMKSLHRHNEMHQLKGVIEGLSQGQTYALISDAGMPLISDPGHALVQACYDQGCQVIPISGACSVISAVAASGLCVNGFSFIGFLPSKQGARRTLLREFSDHPRAWVFFEAPHRMKAMVEDLMDIMPASHRVAVAHELTKRHESVVLCTLEALSLQIESGAFQRGEHVIVIEGCPVVEAQLTSSMLVVIQAMCARLRTSEIVDWVHALTQVPKNKLYECVVNVRKAQDESS